ncbi:uncharacterized protein FFM5_05945 [Fusarium fujikuroi]|nr:uncharacterized protein FFM5_05945 [Fusarium fujikuroi]
MLGLFFLFSVELILFL